MGGFSRRKNTTGIGVTRGRTGGFEGIRHTRDMSNVTLDVTHVTFGGGFDTLSEGLDDDGGGGCLYIPRADVFSFSF